MSRMKAVGKVAGRTGWSRVGLLNGSLVENGCVIGDGGLTQPPCIRGMNVRLGCGGEAGRVPECMMMVCECMFMAVNRREIFVWTVHFFGCVHGNV